MPQGLSAGGACVWVRSQNTRVPRGSGLKGVGDLSSHTGPQAQEDLWMGYVLFHCCLDV